MLVILTYPEMSPSWLSPFSSFPSPSRTPQLSSSSSPFLPCCVSRPLARSGLWRFPPTLPDSLGLAKRTLGRKWGKFEGGKRRRKLIRCRWGGEGRKWFLFPLRPPSSASAPVSFSVTHYSRLPRKMGEILARGKRKEEAERENRRWRKKDSLLLEPRARSAVEQEGKEEGETRHSEGGTEKRKEKEGGGRGGKGREVRRTHARPIQECLALPVCGREREPSPLGVGVSEVAPIGASLFLLLLRSARAASSVGHSSFLSRRPPRVFNELEIIGGKEEENRKGPPQTKLSLLFSPSLSRFLLPFSQFPAGWILTFFLFFSTYPLFLRSVYCTYRKPPRFL